MKAILFLTILCLLTVGCTMTSNKPTVIDGSPNVVFDVSVSEHNFGDTEPNGAPYSITVTLDNQIMVEQNFSSQNRPKKFNKEVTPGTHTVQVNAQGKIEQKEITVTNEPTFIAIIFWSDVSNPENSHIEIVQESNPRMYE